MIRLPHAWPAVMLNRKTFANRNVLSYDCHWLSGWTNVDSDDNYDSNALVVFQFTESRVEFITPIIDVIVGVIDGNNAIVDVKSHIVELHVDQKQFNSSIALHGVREYMNKLLGQLKPQIFM